MVVLDVLIDFSYPFAEWTVLVGPAVVPSLCLRIIFVFWKSKIGQGLYRYLLSRPDVECKPVVYSVTSAFRTFDYAVTLSATWTVAGVVPCAY